MNCRGGFQPACFRIAQTYVKVGNQRFNGVVRLPYIQTEVSLKEVFMVAKPKRDVEKSYPKKAFIAKLRRLADALEQEKPFVIQVDGERVYIPVDAIISVEHERSKSGEEMEFQLKWQRKR